MSVGVLYQPRLRYDSGPYQNVLERQRKSSHLALLGHGSQYKKAACSTGVHWSGSSTVDVTKCSTCDRRIAGAWRSDNCSRRCVMRNPPHMQGHHFLREKLCCFAISFHEFICGKKPVLKRLIVVNRLTWSYMHCANVDKTM
jgi:hypothetical protein